MRDINVIFIVLNARGIDESWNIACPGIKKWEKQDRNSIEYISLA